MYDWNTMIRFEHPPPFLYIEARALLQCVEVRNIHIVIRGGMRGHGGRYGSSDAVAIGTWEGKIR